MELVEVLRGAYFRKRHSTLLAAIVAALAVRPLLGESNTASFLFSVALLLVLLLALVTMQVGELVGDREVLLAQRRRRTTIAWALALPALVERVYVLFTPSTELYAVGAISWLLFLAFVTWSLLGNLLKHKEVTSETISLSVSIYLLLGLTWGVLYVAISQLQPGAFHFADSSTPPTELHEFPILIYFSLTTLSTVGFGDITPLTLQARYAAVAEGIAGQLYLAILVARLVGVQMSRK